MKTSQNNEPEAEFGGNYKAIRALARCRQLHRFPSSLPKGAWGHTI